MTRRLTASSLQVGAGIARRVLDSVAPPDSDDPTSVSTATGALLAGVGTLVGCGLGVAAGLLALFLVRARPEAPAILLGVLVGVVVGIVLCIALAARVAAGRAKGGWALVLLPVTLVAAPLLVLGTAFEKLRRRLHHRPRRTGTASKARR